MRKQIRRPSNATAIACLALFVALGGSGYAAIVLPNNSVGTKQIKTGAVTSQDVRNNALRSPDIRNGAVAGRDIKAGAIGGREIAESQLGAVPRATSADTLGGFSAAQLKLRCPAGTLPASAACIETSPRPAESFGQADNTCDLANRRLPSYPELKGFLSPQRPVASGGEFTGSVSESSATPGAAVALVMLNNTGSSIEFVTATGATPRAFRCLAAATN